MSEERRCIAIMESSISDKELIRIQSDRIKYLESKLGQYSQLSLDSEELNNIRGSENGL